MTEGGTMETKHSQMRILARFLPLMQKTLHSLHCPLTKAIGLRIQGTGCDVSKSIATTELLEGSRCTPNCNKVDIEKSKKQTAKS